MLARPLFLDKKYTVVGDAILNAAATLSTVVVGRPRSVRVRNRLLSKAFKRLNIALPTRHDQHELAEMYEGIVGFAYLKLGFTFESLSNTLIYLLKGGCEEEAYTEFIRQLLEKIEKESAVVP